MMSQVVELISVNVAGIKFCFRDCSSRRLLLHQVCVPNSFPFTSCVCLEFEPFPFSLRLQRRTGGASSEPLRHSVASQTHNQDRKSHGSGALQSKSLYLFCLHMNTPRFLFVTFSRLTGHRSTGSLTSPKAPRPITFRISKSSLCSRMSFTVVVNGFTATHRRAGVISSHMHADVHTNPSHTGNVLLLTSYQIKSQ